MFYITGDTHGDFQRLENFACIKKLQREKDTIIILGDVGINYNLGQNNKDELLKEFLSYSDYSLFCIKGNHEKYPEDIETYKTKEWNGGIVFYEENYPSILFAKDGEIYDINGYKCLVIGGAYSVDKYYRIQKGWHWFPDEQPSEETKKYVEKQLEKVNWKVDFVLSHTCPYDHRPTQFFMQGLDQRLVDNTTEHWMQKIADKLDFTRWYFGHFHGEWESGKYKMMYYGIEKFPQKK
jgi:3-oxoacid CoA-transferase subunit A